MVSFDSIDEARKILGLGEVATLKEIKDAYTKLAHQYHPDKHRHVTEEEAVMIRKINKAYKLLSDYCANYRYSFKEEAVSQTYSYKEYMRKWHDNWFYSI